MEHVMGICKRHYPNGKNPKPFFELVIRRPIETVNADNFKKEGWGFDTEIPYRKEPIKVNPAYVSKIIESGAFVPDRPYDAKMGSNPDDFYETWVDELIPVDDEIKKHFSESLKSVNKA